MLFKPNKSSNEMLFISARWHQKDFKRSRLTKIRLCGRGSAVRVSSWSQLDASICFRHLDSRGEQERGGGAVISHCSAAVMNVSLAAVPDRIAAALCQRNLVPRSKRCATVSGYSYLTSLDRPGPGMLHVPYFSVS